MSTTPERPLAGPTEKYTAADPVRLLPGESGKEGDLESGTALCLSGGGIRSAAFSLGVLQALAQRQLLREFHYLSTVSGGGYIGAWLTRCIAERDPKKGPTVVAVEQERRAAPFGLDARLEVTRRRRVPRDRRASLHQINPTLVTLPVARSAIQRAPAPARMATGSRTCTTPPSTRPVSGSSRVIRPRLRSAT